MITNEMKLSKEQIAKVFALYLGCQIVMPKSGRTAKLLGIALAKWLYINDGTDWRDYEHFPFQLILKPLSEITDSDAIEVFKMHFVGFKANHTEKEQIAFGKSLAKHPNDLKIRVTDFLRSKSYALPAFGIDLFESSLAIPKQ